MEKLVVAKFVLLITVFLALNSTLNLANKWALGVYGFRFPFLLTSTHMLFSFCVLAPIALREPIVSHKLTLKKHWKGIIYIGTFLALNIALNNISLQDISLSLNQVIRSSLPVVTCVLAIFVEKKMPSHFEAVSLFILTLGVMIAVWQGSVTGKPYAIASCLASMVCNGAMMAFSSKVLSEKLEVVKLTFYTAPVSLACLAPFFWLYELPRFSIYYVEHVQGVWVIMFATSINALCYNMVHSLVIQHTSAVTSTVLGEVKIVGLLILSAMLLGEGKEFTFKMTVGCVAAMVGFCMYSHAMIKAHRLQMAKVATAAMQANVEEIELLNQPTKDQADGKL